MARPKKDQAPDLTKAQELTDGLIARLTCPAGKLQTFMRDTKAPGLRVRVTPASTKNPEGVKAFVYEAKLNRQTIRRTLGDVRTLTIDAARIQARELATTIKNEKQDPRELERQQAAELAARHAIATAQAVTVADVWPRYLSEGKPKRRDAFKPGYLADLKVMAAAGGEKKKRGEGTTRPGPLFPLMGLALSAISEDALTHWFDTEARTSKHQAARALMMFRGFLRWCSARPEYRSMVNREAGKAPAIVEAMPQLTRRTDCLESAHVAGWFEGTKKLGNRTLATYLDALLLTGARREEMAALKWVDVDFRSPRLTLADKVESTRTIPLTPYLAQQLATLPRVTLADGTASPYVFASSAKGGRITDPRAAMATVKRDAGISVLTVHGLRRSFSLLGEAAGAPAGAIAQVMGHKPSATAEGYRPRSVDALRSYLAQIEAYILALGKIQFVPKADPAKLELVAV